jgi:hypothetical protein
MVLDRRTFMALAGAGFMSRAGAHAQHDIGGNGIERVERPHHVY